MPEDQVRVLKTLAAQAGKSLQAYMQELITRETTKPTMAEMAARLEREASAQYITDDVLHGDRRGARGPLTVIDTSAFVVFLTQHGTTRHTEGRTVFSGVMPALTYNSGFSNRTVSCSPAFTACQATAAARATDPSKSSVHP
ncbi:hypothetical protein [Streptomyces sp. SLBN-31]|uniref:hypothetical protein n=1 Tax=Streptomyces sp. SLBN-31 TaxID=2768444 RepID=UPI0021B47DF8|nr:hypothetical protein [Streptomyces sp. SLBN-31]